MRYRLHANLGSFSTSKFWWSIKHKEFILEALCFSYCWGTYLSRRHSIVLKRVCTIFPFYLYRSRVAMAWGLSASSSPPSPATSTPPSTTSVDSSSNTPTMPAEDQPQDETSKLRTFLGILRKWVDDTIPTQLRQRPNFMLVVEG